MSEFWNELTICGAMCCATLMEQGCCYFGSKNGRKDLAHRPLSHVLRI